MAMTKPVLTAVTPHFGVIHPDTGIAGPYLLSLRGSGMRPGTHVQMSPDPPDPSIGHAGVPWRRRAPRSIAADGLSLKIRSDAWGVVTSPTTMYLRLQDSSGQVSDDLGLFTVYLVNDPNIPPPDDNDPGTA